MAGFAILRFEKMKTMAGVAGRGQHNERERDTPNADPERAHLNERLLGSGDAYADVQTRLDAMEFTRKIRTDAILAVEYMATTTPGHFDPDDRETIRAWAMRTVEWAQRRHGVENVVAAHLHLDETTPNLHLMVVPITPDGRLSFKDYSRGKVALRDMHDDYQRAVSDFGLECGVRGSKRTHLTMQQMYARTEQARDQARGQVAARVEIDPPGLIVRDPQRYTAAQEDKVRSQVIEPLAEGAVRVRLAEDRARRAEATVAALERRVGELGTENRTMKEDYKKLIAQVKGIDLTDVIRALGGERDRYDTHKWRVNGEHISINRDLFYNHDRAQGSRGAIDLVMSVTGYDFRQAVTYLAHEGGRDLAIAASAQYGARQGETIAERVARGERAPLVMPERVEALWPQVRAYLTGERGIPSVIVDARHDEGTIYAARYVDATGHAHTNAVFVRQDAAGQVVGAAWRGADPGSTLSGLATGTRREAGHFSYRVGEPVAAKTPQYIIAESPIDAMSRHALLQAESTGGLRGEYVFVSNDGHGSLPRRQIEEGLAMGALVRCAFDNDAGGDTLWQQVTEAYPEATTIARDRPPAGMKDWNEALQAREGQPPELGPEREQGRDTRANERR